MENIGDYVAFDLEFNEGEVRTDIIQISAVKFINHQEVAAFDSFVYTDQALKSFINGLTGITKATIDKAPKLDTVIAQFSQFVGSLPLIGYNAMKSDIPLLQAAGLDYESQYAVDVYEEVKARRLSDMHGIANLKLHTVAAYFNVGGRSHNALDDARMTALVYEALLEQIDLREVARSQEQTHATHGLFDGIDLSALFKED